MGAFQSCVVSMGVHVSAQTMMGRPLHIEVAEQKPDRRGFGGAPRGGGGGGFDDERPRYGAQPPVLLEDFRAHSTTQGFVT